LHQTVAYELKALPLGIDGRLFMDRTVLEAEHKSRGDSIFAHGLDQVAISQHLAVQCAEYEKTVQGTLGVAYRNGLRRQHAGPECSSRENESSDQLLDLTNTVKSSHREHRLR
jgi:hypothetical protein